MKIYKINSIKRIIVLLLIISLNAFAFAAKTEIKGVYKYKLSNGLELYVAQNNCAPLVYIEIAVKAGAVTQTPETAGLFHLYEHMMFKGNDKYPDQASFKAAMNKLGTSEWNGSTGVDRVNYFFTIPSSLVKEGLDFWSHAIRNPLMDSTEFENEKLVVLSEINGNFSDPNRIYYAGLCKALYGQAPWTLDSGGSPAAVKNATVQQLLDIQHKYYIPQNAALFVGGDVKPDEVYKYVKEIFGDWKNSEKNSSDIVITSKTPFDKDVKYVYANPSLSGSFIKAEYYLRGPDGEKEAIDTYGADVWSDLMSDPSGPFIETLCSEKDLSIPDADYVYSYYYTQRASGRINFSAVMLNDGPLNPVKKGEKFLSVLKQKIIEPMATKADYYSQADIDSTSRRIEGQRIYSLETAEGILSSLSAVWSSCDGDYFLTYDNTLSNVKVEEITDYVNKYIYKKNGVLMISVSPDVYSEYKDEFDKNGYTLITQDNAFWWR